MTTERDGTMTLRDRIKVIPTREEPLGGQRFKYVKLCEVLDAIDAHLATRDAVVSDEDVELACRVYNKAPGHTNTSGYATPHMMRAALESLASREVAVPDAKGDPDDVPSWVKKCTDAAGVALYIAGWNACRKVMLASQDEVK